MMAGGAFRGWSRRARGGARKRPPALGAVRGNRKDRPRKQKNAVHRGNVAKTPSWSAPP
jgi:hypothetical protein